jgi:uncharacterized membrane protein YbhN (UPF0104 family)
VAGADRLVVGPVSLFMNYGDDWPPATVSQQEKVARRTYALWQKALARVILAAVVWAAGALVLHLLVPAGNTLEFHDPSSGGRSTDVTTTLPPHPAKIHSHP